MNHTLQTLHIVAQGELPRFLSRGKQAPLNIRASVDLGEKLPSSRSCRRIGSNDLHRPLPIDYPWAA